MLSLDNSGVSCRAVNVFAVLGSVCIGVRA